MVNIYAEFTDLYPNKNPGMGKAQLPRTPHSGSEVVPKEQSPHPWGVERDGGKKKKKSTELQEELLI